MSRAIVDTPSAEVAVDLGGFVVDAVVLEGRSCRDVAASHGVSKSWVAELVARYRTM